MDKPTAAEKTGYPINGKNFFEEKQFLLFEAAENLYGIDILKITEILKPLPVTRLPNAENYVLGVINLRGNIVPIIDIRKILKNEYTDLTPYSRIIICVIQNKNIGILVEKVQEVISLKENEIEGEELKGFSENFIEGIGRAKEKLFLIFNLPMLIGNYTPLGESQKALPETPEAV